MREHWTFEPSITFLNHGSFGGCPRVVLEAQSELRAQMEREPGKFLLRDLEGRLDEARVAAAAFVGARPEDLGFVRNATEGVNAVLRSLRFEAGDELLVTDHEYNACRNVLELVADRSGARVVVVELGFAGLTEDLVVERVLAAVTEKTRLALLDHVTSPTGLVLPIARLARELSGAGVDTLVDGAHGPGMVELDLSTLGVDYYTANFHKWVCAPKGSAMLWVREARQDRVHAAVLSHGFNSPRKRGRWLEEMDWPGTTDPNAWLCVPHAIETIGGLLEGGWPAVRAHNRELVLRGRSILASALGAKDLPDESLIGSLAAVPLPPGEPGPPSSALDTGPLAKALYDEHQIDVIVPGWPAPPARLLRLSAHLYNTEADFHALVDALGALGVIQ